MGLPQTRRHAVWFFLQPINVKWLFVSLFRACLPGLQDSKLFLAIEILRKALDSRDDLEKMLATGAATGEGFSVLCALAPNPRCHRLGSVALQGLGTASPLNTPSRRISVGTSAASSPM